MAQIPSEAEPSAPAGDTVPPATPEVVAPPSSSAPQEEERPKTPPQDTQDNTPKDSAVTSEVQLIPSAPVNPVSAETAAATEAPSPNPSPQPPNPPTPTREEVREANRKAAVEGAARSRDDVWGTKRIRWPPGDRDSESTALIVMQSRNGPCSLIALCNVLILRGDIRIRPSNRKSVSYEYLSSLIADYMVTKLSEEDAATEGLSEALSKIHDLQYGMNINSVWSDQGAFKQLGEGGELKLFQLCGVDLVHGWLADPSSSEYGALLKVGDYDEAVNLIVHADHLTSGQLVESSDQPNTTNGDNQAKLSEEQMKTVSDALIIRQFLENNSSQLTYYGLFTLSTALPAGKLCAFFRNSHLSVLLRPPTALADQGLAPLYTLVTDSAFWNEPAVVWESLEDVDGGASTFVDGNFRRSSTEGGDYSGSTAQAVAEAQRGVQEMTIAPGTENDLILAQQLQEQEDRAAADARRRYERRRRELEAQQGGERREEPRAEQPRHRVPAGVKDKKGKNDCVVM